MNINKPLITHDFGSIEIVDGIMYAIYAQGIHVDLKIAKQIVETRLDYQPNIMLPGYADTTGIESLSKEAREYLAKKGSERIIAAGLLTVSPISRMIGNFYLKVNKPIIPTRLFKSKEIATLWLEQFKNLPHQIAV